MKLHGDIPGEISMDSDRFFLMLVTTMITVTLRCLVVVGIPMNL